jgi:hypothetical protein
MSHIRLTHSHTPAEGVLLRAIEIVQRYCPTDSGLSKEQLLDELFDVLDGPEAAEVYQTLKAGRHHHEYRRQRHWHHSFAG